MSLKRKAYAVTVLHVSSAWISSCLGKLVRIRNGKMTEVPPGAIHLRSLTRAVPVGTQTESHTSDPNE